MPIQPLPHLQPGQLQHLPAPVHLNMSPSKESSYPTIRFLVVLDTLPPSSSILTNSTSNHSMQTRSKTRSNNPKALIATRHPLPSKLTYFVEAQKDPKWRQLWLMNIMHSSKIIHGPWHPLFSIILSVVNGSSELSQKLTDKLIVTRHSWLQKAFINYLELIIVTLLGLL